MIAMATAELEGFVQMRGWTKMIVRLVALQIKQLSCNGYGISGQAQRKLVHQKDRRFGGKGTGPEPTRCCIAAGQLADLRSANRPVDQFSAAPLPFKAFAFAHPPVPAQGHIVRTVRHGSNPNAGTPSTHIPRRTRRRVQRHELAVTSQLPVAIMHPHRDPARQRSSTWDRASSGFADPQAHHTRISPCLTSSEQLCTPRIGRFRPRSRRGLCCIHQGSALAGFRAEHDGNVVDFDGVAGCSN